MAAQQDLRETIRRLDEDIRRADSYSARVYRASLLAATGEPEKALADLQRALVLQPGAWRPLFIKAEALRKLGRLQDAEAALAQARALPRSNDGFERDLAVLQRRIADPLVGDEADDAGFIGPPKHGMEGDSRPRRTADRSRPRRPRPGDDTSPGRNGKAWN